jgi:hypothetical protein
MKAFAVIVILTALYLLYRIAFPPKQTGRPQGAEPSESKPPEASNVVGKSRFVRANCGQPAPTPATPLKTEKSAEKPVIFAAGNEKCATVIPSGELSEVFGETSEPDPEDLDIPPDDDPDETGEPDLEEESEDLRPAPGREAEVAGGFTFDELTEAVASENHPEVLYGIAKTDMFEQLVSGDSVRAARISAVLDRYEQSFATEDAETEDSESEYGSFNIADFLS